MSTLKIHSKNKISSTVIPNCFFDTYMLYANGEFLKVYLYFYRWHNVPDHELSIASVADTLNMTESDVIRALKYWERESLLSLDTDTSGTQIFGITFNPILPKEQTGSVTALKSSVRPDVSSNFEKPSYSMQDISRFSSENHGDQLFFVISQYLGRPITQTDMNTVVFFNEKLGFSIDLIEYLFEYCASNNHRSIHYIEKVAISWAQKGIQTVSAAKAENTYYNKTYFSVLKAFGITGRSPSEGEIAYIKRWHEEYCFPLPLILEACRRTILAIHNPSFEYTERILKKWKEKNVTNMADVESLDKAHEASKNARASKKAASAAQTPDQKTAAVRRSQNRFGNFDQRVYDYGDLEQKLVKKLRGNS